MRIKTLALLDEKKNVKDPRGIHGIVEKRKNGWYFKPDFKQDKPENWSKVFITTWEQEFNNGRNRA